MKKAALQHLLPLRIQLTDTAEPETAYRLYSLDSKGRIITGRDAFASSDEAAIHQAKQMLERHDIEIWQGRRRVGLIRASLTAKDSPKKSDE